MKNFGANRVFKIACGANGADYHWTEVLMAKRAGSMNGLSLHYYTLHAAQERARAPPRSSTRRIGSARCEARCAWRSWSPSTPQIMDKYDPEKRSA